MPKKTKKQSNNNFKYIIYCLTILAIILFILMSKTARAAVYVSIFIVLNMLISTYKRVVRFAIEFEILTLGIVLCTITFGIKAGLVIAILGGILSFFSSLNFSPFSFPMLVGYILMAILSYALSFLPITILGLIVTLANNLFVFSVYHLFFRYDIMKNVCFGVSNILFNFIIFTNIAPFLIKIIV